MVAFAGQVGADSNALAAACSGNKRLINNVIYNEYRRIAASIA